MINEISVNLPSKFLISTITKSSDKNLDQLSINNSFEAETFKLDPKFEKTIDKIKDNYLKSVSSNTTNPSAITSFVMNLIRFVSTTDLKQKKFEL